MLIDLKIQVKFPIHFLSSNTWCVPKTHVNQFRWWPLIMLLRHKNDPKAKARTHVALDFGAIQSIMIYCRHVFSWNSLCYFFIIGFSNFSHLFAFQCSMGQCLNDINIWILQHSKDSVFKTQIEMMKIFEWKNCTGSWFMSSTTAAAVYHASNELIWISNNLGQLNAVKSQLKHPNHTNKDSRVMN